MVFLKKPKKTGFFWFLLVLIGFYMVFLGILAAKLGRSQIEHNTPLWLLIQTLY